MENDIVEPEIRCSYCGKRAVFETIILGTYVCDEDDCILNFARDECLVEEVTDEDHLEYGTLSDGDVEDVF